MQSLQSKINHCILDFSFGLSLAIEAAAPRVLAEPPMSNFINSIMPVHHLQHLASHMTLDSWPRLTTIFPQYRPPTFRLYPPESKVRPLPTMPTFRLTSPPVQCHARLQCRENKRKRWMASKQKQQICESDSKRWPPWIQKSNPFTPGE